MRYDRPVWQNIEELIDRGDSVPLRFFVIANGVLALFVGAANAFSVLVIRSMPKSVLDPLRAQVTTSAAFIVPAAVAVIVSSIVALAMPRLLRPVLIAQTVLLCAGAIATLAWAVHAVAVGFPPDVGASWTAGFITMSCAYPVYLLRRVMPGAAPYRGVRRYLYLIAIAVVVPIDIGVGIRVMAVMGDFVRRIPPPN